MIKYNKIMLIEEKYYTPKEISELLKVAYLTVYRWIQTDKLKTYKAGKQYRIKKEDLDKFVKGYKGK